MKINNGNENIEFSNKIAKELTKSDLQAETANSVNETIFKNYDKNNDGKLSTDELAAVLNDVDANGDGTVMDQEITDAVNKMNNVKAEKKTEYINFLKNMAAKNAEKVKDDANVGNSYTIQLGEQFDDLIIRIMKAQGESDADAKVGTDKYNKYAAQFKADNPDAFKANDDGSVKWLVASKKVYIRTNTQSDSTDAMKAVKDKNNSDDVVKDYVDWRDNGKEKYEYKVGGPAYTRKGADATSDTDTDTDATTDTADVDKKAEEHNPKLRRTYGSDKGWYYSETEKTHYWWNGSDFVKTPGIGSVSKDGTFTVANGKTLRATYGTGQGWYYEVGSNPPVHWKWDETAKKFIRHTEVKMINKDGSIVKNDAAAQSPAATKVEKTDDKISLTSGDNKTAYASLYESGGAFSKDAHLKINSGKYAGNYKFVTDDNDNLNYGKFDVKSKNGGPQRITIGNYKVTKLESTDGKTSFDVKTDDTGHMTVNVNSKWVNLEDFMAMK